MLVWINEDKQVLMFNESISYEDAQKYTGEKCLWVDGLEIKPPIHEGKETLVFLSTDNTIRYEFVEKKEEIKHLSDTERAILETAINTEYLACLAEINNT